MQPCDQLLIEVAAFGQWPAADAVGDLTPGAGLASSCVRLWN
ncbi:MAG: hypothetical protein ACKOEO_10095 [Planctomycetaceae bacterium]